MSKRILVFDFGASSARAMFCSHEDGRLSLEEIHRFENRPIEVGGHLCWDIDELFEQMKIAISFGVFNGGFDAISIDTWGVDFGLIDKDGKLLSNPVCYRDERTNGMPEEVYELISPEELFKKSGIQPQNINTIFQLQYLLNHDKNLIFRAEKLLMMPDLFAYFLTGKMRSEFTEATTTQLIDPKAKGWNIKLIETLKLPKRIFCPIIQAGEVYGTLTQELCDEFRIEPVPVYACCTHDTASAVLAVPTSEEHFVFISCGTWTLFGTELKRPITSEDAYKAGLTNEGGYLGTTTLIKNIMGLWLIQETKRFYEKKGEEYSFSELEELAKNAKPFSCFINPNDESFVAPDNMPLKIQEYCRKTGQYVPETVGEIVRCIDESLALEFSLTLESISALTEQSYDCIHMIGGGTKSGLLCSFTANAAGVRVVAGPTEATALGNGICTLVASGELESVAKARELISKSGLTQVYEPTEQDGWAEAVERYKQLTMNNE